MTQRISLAALVTALLFHLPSEIAASEVPFSSSQTIGSGFDGFSVTSADVDGDGDLDVLGAANDDDEIAWWKNSAGDGSAWTKSTIDAAFGGPRSIIAADLDSDGDLDVLAAAFDDDEIAWWENTAGDGSAWTKSAIGTSFDGASSVAVTDVDGDGDLDVLAAARRDDEIAWWENSAGDGSTWTKSTIDNGFDGADSVAVADVDGDGDLDVLAASRLAHEIGWWENTAGDGSAWTQITIDSGFIGPRSVAVADLDGDGDLDVLAAAHGDDEISWWENTAGDGSAWTKHVIDAVFRGAHSVAAVDVDRDGDLDVLAAALDDDYITWWENTAGDGSAWTERTIEASFDGARSVIAADLDGDGDLDALGAADEADQIAWWENETIHRSAMPMVEHTVGTSGNTLSITAADVDGDGDLDALAAAFDDDEIAWWENTAGDASAWTKNPIDASFDEASSITAADMDGDGDLDVFATAFDLDEIAWWENSAGDGSAWTKRTIDSAFDGPADVTVADVDGDGDFDVLGAAWLAEEISWWENTSGNGSTWTKSTIEPVFEYATSVAAADLDGDGDLDVLGATYLGNEIAWWENIAGDGSTWTERIVAATVGGVGTAAAADIDGDGDLDVLGASSHFGSSLTWWENTTGNGSTWNERTIDSTFPVAQFRFVGTADLDGDGDLDALASSTVDDWITWWENTAGNGSTWTKHAVDEDINVFEVAVADLDGDGSLDIFAGGRDTNLIKWWKNGGGQFALPTLDAVTDSSSPVGSEIPILLVELAHRGRPGDADIELATLELLLEEAPGDPLSDSETNARIESLALHLDDGDGVFDPLLDTQIHLETGPFAPVGGVLTLVLADADTDFQTTVGASRQYFLTVELALGSLGRDLLVTHVTEASSTGEMVMTDIPLELEFSTNVTASAVTASSHVLLSEIRVDEPGGPDLEEYFELTGEANTSLDGLTYLVIGDGAGGSGVIEAVVDLAGQSLDANGFFVAAEASFTLGTADLTVDLPFENGDNVTHLLVSGFTGALDDDLDTNNDGTLDTEPWAAVGDCLALLSPDATPLTYCSESVGPDGSFLPGHVYRCPDENRIGAFDPVGGYDTPGQSNACPTALSVGEVQGSDASGDSPWDGQLVLLEDNVVIGLTSDGFFLQSQTGQDDGDSETSDGIFVFLGSAPSVAVGDQVDVEGEVAEFFGMTQITSNPSVTVDASGLPLPSAQVLDIATPSPTQPQSETEYERFESMRIQVSGGRVTGPNQSFGSDTTAEVHVTAAPERTFRETGIEYPGVGGLPVWDGNPEVFELDPDRLGLANQEILAGSSFDAVGILGYEFDDWELWPTSLSVTDVPTLDPVRARASDEATVGSLNLYFLFDDVDDPGTGDDGNTVSTVEYERRLEKHSLYIRIQMSAPQVLAVQEVEHLQVLQDLADRIAFDDAGIVYTPFLEIGNGILHTGYLVQESLVTVDAVTQLGADEILTYDGSLLHDRPPLRLDATLADGEALVVFNLHQRSLNNIDDPTIGERVRQKRLEQAQSVAQKIQDEQTANPQARILVVGDLNAFEFTDGYVDVIGQIIGDITPSENLLSGPDLVDPNFVNATLGLAAEERYSFVFRGSANALDHALMSQRTAGTFRDVEYARGNADAAVVLGEQDGTPLRSSDHDGLVVYVVPSHLFTDGFEAGNTSAWSSTVP